MVANEGFEVAFHGTYREIVPNERLVTTELYEGVPDATEDDATLNTTTFVETDGVTTLTTLVECHTREVRDAIVGSGDGGRPPGGDGQARAGGGRARVSPQTATRAAQCVSYPGCRVSNMCSRDSR
jgi:uncharacterized protein YndB with AHSA1/START domain